MTHVLGAGDASDMNTLIVTLHRRPGALDRVVGLLRRHGCALVALGFGPADEPDVDRARVTFVGSSSTRVAKQLTRLVDVISASDSSAQPAAESRLPFHFQADGMSDGKHQET